MQPETMTQQNGNSKGRRLFGILMIITGLVAFAAPFQTTLLVEVILGISLLFSSGLLLGVFLTLDEQFRKRLVFLVLAIVNFGMGLLFLLHPAETLVGLTLVLIIYLFVSGVIYLVSGFIVMTLSDRDGFPMVAAGGMSILIGIIFSARYPETSAVVLGIGAGASLLVGGLNLVGIRAGRAWFTGKS